MAYDMELYRDIVLDLEPLDENPPIKKFEFVQILETVLALMRKNGPVQFGSEIEVDRERAATFSVTLPGRPSSTVTATRDINELGQDGEALLA